MEIKGQRVKGYRNPGLPLMVLRISGESGESQSSGMHEGERFVGSKITESRVAERMSSLSRTVRIFLSFNVTSGGVWLEERGRD